MPLRPPWNLEARIIEAGNQVSTLYIVGTPIGNLEDLTLRAARILGEVSLIAAEDTRVTRRLLSHLGVHIPMISFNEHTQWQRPRTPGSPGGC